MEGNGFYTLSGVLGVLGIEINSQNGLESNDLGWTIVVAYQNPALPTRSINIWDVYQIVYQVLVLDITVSGFTTPPMGFPLSGKLFLSASNGANYIAGD